jgi:hypothetical protein
MGFERWREIGETVVADLNDHGQFFDTPQGLFYFDNERLRAFPLSGGDMTLAAIINEGFGINPKEHGFQRVLADMQSEATLNGRRVDIRRLAHYDSATKLLYISRFDGQVYRLDGESVSAVPNGTDDIFFFDDYMLWEPYTYLPNTSKGELDRQLVESVNFAESFLSVDEQRKLLRLWMLAVFFGSIQPTKIILLLLGDQGAGKTSALHRIQRLIFGSKANLHSIDKQKQDGFIAVVTTDPLALFDNVDERVSWLPYALSRLATGVTFSRRQLYTTNQKVEYPGVSWLGITSRTVGFMENQPDLPERTLVLRVKKLEEKRAEIELLSAVAQHRGEMWSELLDELNRVVGHLKHPTESVRVRFRMADFASFALQVATVWGCREEVGQIFSKLEQAQADLVFEDEPIHQVLDLWLMVDTNHGRSMDAGALYREWSRLAKDNRFGWPFDCGRSLGQRLGQLRYALREKFDVEVAWDAHDKQYRYGFWPKGMQQAEAASASLAIPDEPTAVEAAAGNAGMF